jgi:hypothetical protein
LNALRPSDDSEADAKDEGENGAGAEKGLIACAKVPRDEIRIMIPSSEGFSDGG